MVKWLGNMLACVPRELWPAAGLSFAQKRKKRHEGNLLPVPFTVWVNRRHIAAMLPSTYRQIPFNSRLSIF